LPAHDIGKCEGNALQPDLPNVEQIGEARTAHSPRDISCKAEFPTCFEQDNTNIQGGT